MNEEKMLNKQMRGVEALSEKGWWSPAQEVKGEVMQLFRPRPHTWLPRLPQGGGRGKEGQDLSTGSSLWRPPQNPHSPPFASQTSAS